MKCYTITEELQRGLVIKSKSIMGAHDPVLSVGDPGSIMHLPLSSDLLRVFNEAATELGLTELTLLRAEVSTNEPLRLIKERNQKSSSCLVHVATNNVGPMWLEANSYEEELQRGRVERRYSSFPSPGVTPVAWGMCIDNNPQGLFIMQPGSSFRICRRGDLQGASPVLIVAWPGSTLRCFAPAKYRQQSAA